MNSAAEGANSPSPSDCGAVASGKKGISIQEEIIYSTQVVEEEEVEEVEEIVEIIEEIEEIEEIIEEEEEEEEEEIVEEKVVEKNEESREDALDNSAAEDDPLPKFRPTNRNQRSVNRSSYERNKKVVAYDADEDWEEEEGEHQVAASRSTRSGRNVADSPARKNHSLNGKRSAASRGDEYSSGSGRSNAEPVYKIAKTRSSADYAEARHTSDSIEMNEIDEDEDEDDDDDEHHDEEEENQHEIVKSAENNLVYTVLGSKKSSNTNARSKKDAPSSQNQESARYIKQMERIDEDEIPMEAIYYEDQNMETVYVAESINQGGEAEQYEQYEGQVVEQDWEGANEATSEHPEEDEEQEGTVQQDQIFLHEDEDGQLYFKDDNGTLQPVYLTADGNYAIAENSSDEQEVEENNRQSATSPQANKSFDDDSFIVPELESTAASSNPNDPDNEDNTVTISLIISEDENGQKRTQVIIPTTDNLKCELCAKSFKTSFQLLRHNRLKHAREEDITTRNFPCDLCPKRYSDQNTLARHRKTHIGDRPFGCLECGKSFPTSTALRRHLTQHNPQSRPLPCIYCGRRFLEKSALTKHEQSHLAGDQRTHTCDICHKSFLQAADLSLHKKNHDPDKKFDCEVCGREFNRLNNLQRHMMVHKQKQGQNQEILACDVCGITYKFMSSLTRHMVTSHMNPEKLRQQAEEQRKKRENNYRRYLENRKMYETQHTGTGYGSGGKRTGGGYRSSNDNDEDTA